MAIQISAFCKLRPKGCQSFIALACYKFIVSKNFNENSSGISNAIRN